MCGGSRFLFVFVFVVLVGFVWFWVRVVKLGVCLVGTKGAIGLYTVG